MDNSLEKYCKLCLSVKNNEHFEKLSDFTMGSLDVLLLKLDVNQNKDVICDICTRKVKKAIKFKSMCLCTDNIIISHVDDEIGHSVDLIEIYAEEKGKDLSLYDLYGYKVCRFCMQLIKGKFISVYEVDTEAIERYIPEINLNIIKNPVVCQKCFDSIGTHCSFLKNCLEVKEKIKSFHVDKGSHSSNEIPSLYIKVEDNIVEQEEIEKEFLKNKYTVEGYDGNVEDNKIKEENLEENSQDRKECMENKFSMETLEDEREIQTESINFKLEESGGETAYRSSFALEAQMPLETTIKSRSEQSIKCRSRTAPLDPEQNLKQTVSKKKLLYCDKCDFVGKYTSCLKRHKVKHEDPSQLQMYKCNECGLQTKYERHIKIHQLMHTTLSTEQMYRCDKCSFTTKYRHGLKTHLLKHKDPSQVRIYKCDECSYKTIFSNRLTAHRIVHRHPSQMQMYKCNKCDFESKRKADVKIHESRHVDSSSGKQYPCGKCSYVGGCSKNLSVHLLIHEEPSRIYKCAECSFQSRFRNSFTRHLSRKHNKSL